MSKESVIAAIKGRIVMKTHGIAGICGTGAKDDLTAGCMETLGINVFLETGL